MPGSVDHKSSPEIHRAIFDRNRMISDSYFAIFELMEELRIGFKSSQKTNIVVSFDVPIAFILNLDSVVLMFFISCNELPSMGDINCQSCFSLNNLTALKDRNQVV